MGKDKMDNLPAYRALPRQGRFWITTESCYTEEELSLRLWILNTRANSGIHRDYLNNPSSWFAEDAQALTNVNEHSWILSNAFKPRHVLTLDDFHVQPVDSQRLLWPALYDLMQKTGDYLLIRNQNLPKEHLNQPMNFVLLDIIHILKALSQNSNINQVREQLELVTKYIRTLEKNVSPIVGSDRLFLVNFRAFVDDEIHPYLTQKIESQLLRDKLGELAKAIDRLSTDRNRILHFALNVNKVNPHPYGFSVSSGRDSKTYPTQAAQECGGANADAVATPLNLLKLSVDQLSNCPNFKLITMQEPILENYATAISDLNKLDSFHKVIDRIMDILGQAGEIYTYMQFRVQTLQLLKAIEAFIDSSAQPIEAIIQANTRAYHQAIRDKQDLTLWKKWLTSEREYLSVFIENQDTLAQYPSTANDLAKTNTLLKDHVSRVISHLSNPKGKEITIQVIAGMTEELNNLLDSMYSWVKIQHALKGGEEPQAPQQKLLASSTSPPKKPPRENKLEPITPFPSSNFGPFFSAEPLTISPIRNNHLLSTGTPNSLINNQTVILGLVVAFPIGLIALYLLLSTKNRNKNNEELPLNHSTSRQNHCG